MGGVWQHDPRTLRRLPRVPLTDPSGPTGDEWVREEIEEADSKVNRRTSVQNGASRENGLAAERPSDHGLSAKPQSAPLPEFVTPMYDDLETNLPKQLMRFSDQAFDEALPLFPRHNDVQAYLEHYAKDVHHLISFHTRVEDAGPLPSPHGTGWKLQLKPSAGDTESAIFDALVVASGHYNVPSIPPIPGLEAWNSAFPNSITHSKFFRNPDPYVNKQTIVVGNAASGLDIAHHLSPHVTKPLYLSIRSAASPIISAGPSSSSEILEVPQIQRLDAHANPPTVTLSDGTVLTGIDRILFCTGYHYSYPFLRSLPSHDLPPVVTDGSRTREVYRHIFYHPRPSLAFVGLGQKIVPFPVVEAQAAVVAGVWSGRVGLCAEGREGMRRWEAELLERAVRRKGEKDFHTLAFPEDAEYLEDCARWAAGEGEEGGQRKDGGMWKSRKIPPTWDARMWWIRGRVPKIKKAFNDLGERRRRVRTMEELGFVFDEGARREVEELCGKT